jgi:hypothetical protein
MILSRTPCLERRREIMRIKFQRLTIHRLKKELHVAEKLNNLRLYKIVWCLILMNDGKSAEQISESLNIGIKTV